MITIARSFFSGPGPLLEDLVQSFEEAPERLVYADHPPAVHRRDDVSGMLQAADERSDPAIPNSLGQEPLVPTTVAFSVGRRTSSPEDGLEGRGIQQEPSFDVGVGDGQNDANRRLDLFQFRLDFASTVIISPAVRVDGDDEQVRP
jgi:hypothetical protein